MVKTLCWLIIVIIISSGSISAVGAPDDTGWVSVVAGIDYQKFQLPDPNNVFVVRMDRANTSLSL
jgi:hypothetical protein